MDSTQNSSNVEVMPTTSLGVRMTNVFVTPGSVFDEVKQSPPVHANWLVPTLILCVLGIISVWLIFSDKGVVQEIREQQQAAIEKKLANMPEAQRAQARSAIEMFSGPTALKLFGTGGVLFYTVAQVILYALVLWLFSKIAFKADFGYVKALELCGLASTILMLRTVFSTLLILITGHAHAKLGPVLLLSPFEGSNFVHLLLANLEVVTLWYLAVLALGFARLSGRSTAVCATFVYGAWGLFTLGMVILGWVSQRAVS